MNLDQLSDKDREALLAEAAEVLRNKEKNEKEERERYKQIVSDEVEMLFSKMKSACTALHNVKTELFDSLQTLITSKMEVYEVKGNQKTHTFTTTDRSKRITIGYKSVSDWDGTEGAGVEKVQAYIQSLARDAESATAVEMLQLMLKPDQKGNLDPRRIVELKQFADRKGDPVLTDGVTIIMNAYKMAKSKTVLLVEERTESGVWRNVELDFADVNIVLPKTQAA